MTEGLWERTERAAEAIHARDTRRPAVALVLGSGLGTYANSLDDGRAIPYADIPGFPVSTVAGHNGFLVIGEVHGLPVVVMQGRVHLYEGYSSQSVTFPLRVLWKLGADRLIITNSAGSLRPELEPGALVAITDHLNLTGVNPLEGENDERFGPRFPDMTAAYDGTLRDLALRAAKEAEIPLETGVYAGLLGPNYETPAEVRMIRTLGADLIGMSTVCEVIVARHMGMRVLGLSCVSNLAAGLSGHPLSHDEVTVTAGRATQRFQALVDSVVHHLAMEANDR